MRKIRVLVVDDSAVLRRAVTQELSNDPALDVVGTAANGRIALARLPQVTPDIVILDVEMPELDGLETLKELRRSYPRLPVIMFSALTERGAEATLDALALGASDYFPKPSGEGGLDASLKVIREELIPEIKALCSGIQQTSATGNGPAPIPSPTLPSRIRGGPVEILAIGSSTGGPNALTEILSHLPANFPVPIVIAQHMPPMFTRLLAERLTAQLKFPVHEGASGNLLQPGQAWVAPGDHHMVIARHGLQARVLLNRDPPENSCRPAVDVLLRSVAATYGGNSLAVILTGMGQDGLRGCERIREAGGQVLAQDEASSVVWGMPGAVARAGLADRVLPLSLIADEITRRVTGTTPAGTVR